MEKIRIAAFGEVLWDMFPTGPVLGGAPFNFAFRMTSLGIPCTILSQVGQDEMGDRALVEMRRLGMDTRCVGRSADWPTGRVEITLDDQGDPDFTILPDMAYDHMGMDEEMKTLITRADCFYFGTVAQRSPLSAKTLTLALDAFAGRHVFLDINLRRNCHTPEVMRRSLMRCTILKINQSELAPVAKIFHISGKNPVDFSREILEACGLEYCLITLGEKGFYARSRSMQEVAEPAYRVNVVDTCGAGDAFSAGFLLRLLQGDSFEDACRFANALGSLVATQKGATQNIATEDVHSLMDGRA